MKKKLEEDLRRAAHLTFESLVFMLPTPELGEEQEGAEVDAAVSVSFEGPFSGRVEVRVCGGLLSTLAVNMLGENETPTLGQQIDALGEIANVVCGNVLPAVAGSDKVFNVLAPQMAKGLGSPGDGAESPAAEVRLGLEQGRVDVVLFLNSDADSYLDGGAA